MTDGYNETYGSDEVAEVTIDTLVAVLAGIVGFATIVGLVILFRWVKGRKVM
jgi:hypothetical protein